MRSILKVNQNVQDQARLRDYIRMYGNKFIFPSDVDTFKLGDVYVILDDGTFGNHSTPYDSASTLPAVTPTMYPSLFTSFNVYSPTPTIGQTVTPSISSVVTVYGKYMYTLS